jgi:catechol 2,3-dioxygenase-like lactoylglutathione lyase family enzyme
MVTSKKTAPLAALELKTFVPARDFDLSKRFYRAIGFQEDWTNGEVALFKSGATSFLLRSEVDAGYATGLQMQILVDSVDDWYEYIRSVLEPFGLLAEAPVNRPWGTRDFVLTDPSGVRWRITQAKSNG